MSGTVARFIPVHPRHPHVEKNHFRLEISRHPQRLDTVSGGSHLMTDHHEIGAEHVPIIGVVIDDQYSTVAELAPGKCLYRIRVHTSYKCEW